MQNLCIAVSSALVVALAALPVLTPTDAFAASGMVISQVYGGGGNAGATYTHDFVEIFNRGVLPVSIAGWTLQYASAAGTSWQLTALSGVIPPGGYYLTQQAQGAGGTTPLPTPDAAGNIALSATAGKVALVMNATALSGACPAGPTITDFVGYGTTANCFEGSGPTPAPSNTNAAIRNSGGCTDTDNNNANFRVGAPTPRNTASPLNERTPVPVSTGSWGRVKTLYR